VKGDIRVTPSPEAGAAPEPDRGAARSATAGPADPAQAPAPDAIDPAAIAAELQALRRGYGLLGDVTGRIGPLLWELAAGTRPVAVADNGPGARSDAAEVRRKLAAKIAELAEPLHKDLRLAILAALALHEATRDEPTYEKRKEWLAKQLARDARTAERRINKAQRQLALEIASELEAQRNSPQEVADADKWYVERFRADFMLDGDHPEAIEYRVIRSNVNGLTELVIALDMPVDRGRPRLPLNVEMVSGGELEVVEEKGHARTRYVIKLPRPLRAGETHECATRVKVLPGGPMRNYYVLRPERRCDRLELRVRFSRQRLPAWVRRVEDEDVHSYNTSDDLPADAQLVTVDLTGEATASFTRLRQHFGSGLQWGW
jgi:hypothetical protein